MISSSSSADLVLPPRFDRWRPGQRDTVQKVLKEFGKGKKHAILDAPTGSGKSLIAYTVGIELVRMGYGPVYYAVATKQLQDQYARTFPAMAVVKGRANHRCVVAPQDTADECRAERALGSSRDCGSYSVCPYFAARDAAMKAQHVVVNYPYLLTGVLPGRWPDPGLLVADEAHAIEDALTGHVGIEFTAKRIADLRLDGNPVQMPYGSAWPHGLGVIAQAVEADIDLLRATLREDGLNPRPGVAKEISRQESFLGRIRGALRHARSMRWLVTADDTRFRADPVRVAPFAAEVLWRRPRNVLLMSATIGDPQMLADRLGIQPDTFASVSMPSHFDPVRRPFVSLPAGRMTRDHEKLAWSGVAAELKRIVRAHNAEKGVVHAVSYDRARRAREAIAPLGIPIFEHEGRDRTAVLNAFRSARPPAVLISPSFEEGVDLPHDECRFQVMLKVPFPGLGDPLVGARKRDDPAWYAWRTAARLVQTYGRGMRAEDDACTTYILDSTYTEFRTRASSYLPTWFTDAEVRDARIVRIPQRRLASLDQWASRRTSSFGAGEVIP